VFLVTGATPAQVIAAGPMLLVVAGLLVGFGAVWGNGCTWGHGAGALPPPDERGRLFLKLLLNALGQTAPVFPATK